MPVYLDHVGSDSLVQLARGLLRHDWVLEARVTFHFHRPEITHIPAPTLFPLHPTVSDFIFAPGAAIPSSLLDRGRPDEYLAERALENEIFALEPYLVAGLSRFMPIVPYTFHVGRDKHSPFSVLSTLH